MKRTLVAAAMVGSIGIGGIAGVVLFGPGLAGAQTPSTTSTTIAPNPASGGGSNEDAAHEAGESAQREAEENSGTFHRGHQGSNEDPAHEATESAEREAQENANQSGPAPTTSPSTVNPAQ